MSFVDHLYRILLLILAGNLVAVLFFVAVYLKSRHTDRNKFDLENFCADLPRDAKLPDPYVLRDGKWVHTDTAGD